MVALDENRLLYPIEYISLVGFRISDIREIRDILEFVISSPETGYSITARATKDFMKDIKEGLIKSGEAEGLISFRLEGKDLSKASPYMTIETWNNVAIE